MKVPAIKCLFLDIGGVLLTDGWDRRARKRAVTRFKLEAAEMEDQVPHQVKVERMERLVEVVQRRAAESAQRFVGRTLEVLIEGPSRTDPTRLRGRSRHNKVVNFEGFGEPGEFVDVEITRATSQTLIGEMSLVARAAR